MESAPTGHPAIHALPGGETAYAVPQSILQSIPKLMPLTGPGNSFAVPQCIPTGHTVMHALTGGGTALLFHNVSLL